MISGSRRSSLFREGARCADRERRGYELVGGSNGRRRSFLSQYQPDITLMDLQMPEMNGIDAIGQFAESSPMPELSL